MKLLIAAAVLLAACHLPAEGIRLRDSFLNRLANASAFDIESRIIGGEIVGTDFPPYHVSIQTLIGSHICSGTIIDEQWVITAGHCVVGRAASRILVSSGSNNIWEPEAYYYVDQIIIHCNYDKPLYHNDIALLRLETPIEWDAHTQPIDLATELIGEGSKVLITGWGKPTPNEDMSQHMRKMEAMTVGYDNCKQRYDGDEGVDSGHICTLSTDSTGVCHGDSGAPVVGEDGKLAGIINWGVPCAKGYPDVSANVLFYLDWIRTQTNGCALQLS